ncbi:MAG: hypothetical protein GC164_02510 [Phycisphaera sp.]|nr:hypothetical protein [Phycisphaera sp.]
MAGDPHNVLHGAGPTASSQGFGPPWLGVVRHRTELDLHWMLTALAMLVAALVFFGWRAMGAVCVTAVLSVGVFVLGRLAVTLLRPGGPRDTSLHALVMGMFTGLSLPMLESLTPAVLAGVFTGLLLVVGGRSHRLRVHACAAVIAGLWVLPVVLVPWDTSALHRPGFATVEAVLKPNHAVIGDVLDHSPRNSEKSWFNSAIGPTAAVSRPDAGALFLHDAQAMLLNRQLLLDRLSDGELPRLTQLLIGATPGPIGATSPLLLIFLGLCAVYRRQSWWGLTLWALVASLATLMVMPMPGYSGWTVVAPKLWALGPAAAITYLAYFILTTPWLLIVMILSPMTAPMSAWGRRVYALLIGCAFTLTVWFTLSPSASMAGLVIAGVLSRPLDRLHRSPFVRVE